MDELARYEHWPDGGASLLIGGLLAGAGASHLLAPKPRTPKLPEPVPLPKEQDIGKKKGIEKRQLQKRQTKTMMTSNWLTEPSLLTRGLSA
jgi:hypothetical protein